MKTLQHTNISNGTVTNHYRPYWINRADRAKVSTTPSGHNTAVHLGLPDALCWIHWKQYHCSFTGQSKCLLPILPLFISNTNTEIIRDPSMQSSYSVQVKCSPRLAGLGKTNLSSVRTRCIKSAITKLLRGTVNKERWRIVDIRLDAKTPFERAFVHGLVNNLRHLSFQWSFMPHYASAHAVTECITLRH